MPSPVPTPVAVNIVPILLSAAPINVKSVVPVDVILYSVPTTKLPAVLVNSPFRCVTWSTFQPQNLVTIKPELSISKSLSSAINILYNAGSSSSAIALNFAEWGSVESSQSLATLPSAAAIVPVLIPICELNVVSPNSKLEAVDSILILFPTTRIVTSVIPCAVNSVCISSTASSKVTERLVTIGFFVYEEFNPSLATAPPVSNKSLEPSVSVSTKLPPDTVAVILLESPDVMLIWSFTSSIVKLVGVLIPVTVWNASFCWLIGLVINPNSLLVAPAFSTKLLFGSSEVCPP